MSHFAPALVATEEEKQWKFIQGLRPDIRRYVGPLKLPSFSRVAEVALRYASSAALARVTALTLSDAQASPDVVTGTILVDSYPVLTLFDSGATYSFVSERVADQLDKMTESVAGDQVVRGLMGQLHLLDAVMRDYVVTIGDFDTLVDLFVLALDRFDMILGMDWLVVHHAIVDCFRKKIMFDSIGKEIIGKKKLVEVVAPLRVVRDLGFGFGGFLASVVDLNNEKFELIQIPIVREFPEVFSKEIAGVPPEREIEFEISLTPDVQPISIPPYRMAPVELQELQKFQPKRCLMALIMVWLVTSASPLA